MSVRDRIQAATNAAKPTRRVRQTMPRLTPHEYALHSLRLQLMSIAQAANGALATMETLGSKPPPEVGELVPPKTLPNLPPNKRR